MRTLGHDEIVHTTGACTRTDILSSTVDFGNETQVSLDEAMCWRGLNLLLPREFVQLCESGLGCMNSKSHGITKFENRVWGGMRTFCFVAADNPDFSTSLGETASDPCSDALSTPCNDHALPVNCHRRILFSDGAAFHIDS